MQAGSGFCGWPGGVGWALDLGFAWSTAFREQRWILANFGPWVYETMLLD